jgi:hypothetical protein
MTTLAFKDVIDSPLWRPTSPAPAAKAAAGCCINDARNGNVETPFPFSFFLDSATALYAYLPHNDEWLTLGSPALAGTFGAGAAVCFDPSQGPRGTIAAGATTTTITLTTALPAAVGVNQLANMGNGLGFQVRVVDNVAGGSGKTEIKRVIANTAGTTPTLTLDSALSFTPGTGAAYEFRSGRLFMLSSGTLASGAFKFYDVLTNSFSASLAITNLPASLATDSTLLPLSESFVPSTANVGEGFLGLIASGAASTTTTVTGSALPAGLAANEYRNFQVRIVTDTANPTATGQRRRIVSHTAGASAVFTVGTAWTVSPSATAVFVVENDDDKILLFTAATTVYNYNISANTWDPTTWAAAGTAAGAGLSAFQSFGVTVDAQRNARHSFVHRFRGAASNTLDVFDLAGSATGAWTAAAAYGGQATTFTTGQHWAYDPVTAGGRYAYAQINGTQRFARYDALNRVLEPWCYLRYPQGTALVGNTLHLAYAIDGTTKLGFLFCVVESGANQFACALQR